MLLPEDVAESYLRDRVLTQGLATLVSNLAAPNRGPSTRNG